MTVATLKRVDLAAIKPDIYVGIATRTAANGEQDAIEVVVFPEAMRGAGEGHYPWDLEPGSMMTNGNVTGTVDAKSGRELSVSFKNGSEKIVVPPGVPIVTFAPAAKVGPETGGQGDVRRDEECRGQAGSKPRHRRDEWCGAADVGLARWSG